MSGGWDGGHRSGERFPFTIELGGDDPGGECWDVRITHGTDSAWDFGNAENLLRFGIKWDAKIVDNVDPQKIQVQVFADHEVTLHCFGFVFDWKRVDSK